MFRCFGYFWWLIGFTDCDVTICSDSDPYGLLVISEPPDAISTPPMFLLLILYPPLPCNREKLRTSFPRLRKTSYHFDSTQTAFPCVLRPCPLYFDLDTLRSTSLYCALLIILRFSSRFISFASILLDILLPTSDYIHGPPHSLTYPYPITIEPDITLLHRTLAIGTDIPGLRTFRSFSFQ